MNYKLNHFKIYQNIIQLMYFINKTISKKKKYYDAIWKILIREYNFGAILLVQDYLKLYSLDNIINRLSFDQIFCRGFTNHKLMLKG